MILMINFLFDQNPYDPDDNCLSAQCQMLNATHQQKEMI